MSTCDDDVLNMHHRFTASKDSPHYKMDEQNGCLGVEKCSCLNSGLAGCATPQNLGNVTLHILIVITALVCLFSNGSLNTFIYKNKFVKTANK